jgi:hypothetical protein
MDSELKEAINSYSDDHPQLRVLASDEAESIRTKVALRFGFREGQAWWWERLPPSSRSFAYSEGEGLAQLMAMAPNRIEPVYLFVTDDDPPPWLCLSGPLQALVEMLNELRFFEYFIIDQSMRWIVFDTHHNALIAHGDGLVFPGSKNGQ